ncbi:MAG: hypothetical protein M3237_09295 [Actinomycetota bacterium]|nr:hypothetical protein [Actinomycetota bacterium]
MTEHDLSTLVRDHVSSDEPRFPGPDAAIARGRRTVRTQRITAGVGVAAVLAVVGALVVPGLPDDARPGGSEGTDPAVQDSLDNYDATAMPGIVEGATRAVFSRSVSDLGEADFSAYDAQGNPLGPDLYDKASGMSISYGDRSTRELSVDLMHAKSEAEGDHEKVCADGTAEGSYLECTVETFDDGDVLVTYLTALRPFHGEGWYGVTRDELATRNPDNLWFQRHVEVIKSETFLTTADETIKARSLAAAKDAFIVPVTDLAEIASDPRLVLPEPPLNPDGCGAWTRPDSDSWQVCD